MKLGVDSARYSHIGAINRVESKKTQFRGEGSEVAPEPKCQVGTFGMWVPSVTKTVTDVC